MRRILVIALAVCFVFGLALASGAVASQKDAKANGKDAALKEINLAKGQFDKGELYVFAYDLSGRNIAHPKNPKLIGKDLLNVPDPDGKMFRFSTLLSAEITFFAVETQSAFLPESLMRFCFSSPSRSS